MKNIVTASLVVLLGLSGCIKKNDVAILATVTGAPLSSVTSSGALSGGNAESDGGNHITAKGVCWGTRPHPTIDIETKTNDGSGTGSYSSTITGLTPATTYYLRAYATNNAGTAYGNEYTFTTTPGYFMHADVSGTAFDVTNCYAEFTDTVLAIIGVTGTGLYRKPSIILYIAHYTVPGEYNFDSTYANTAVYEPDGTTTSSALFGSVTITAVTSTTISGVFNFTCYFGVVVSGGTFTAVKS